MSSPRSGSGGSGDNSRTTQWGGHVRPAHDYGAYQEVPLTGDSLLGDRSQGYTTGPPAYATRDAGQNAPRHAGGPLPTCHLPGIPTCFATGPRGTARTPLGRPSPTRTACLGEDTYTALGR